MRVLVVGSGGREHAIVRKLVESTRITALYALPGNGGISKDATCIPGSAMDKPAVIAAVREHGIDYVVVAPDNPLVDGMVDALTDAGIPSFGPNRLAAELEGSKAFSKALMQKYGIPTAAYAVFDSAPEALEYIEGQSFPLVIKADGLALGKGVIIAQSLTEAQDAVKSMFDGAFGASGSRVVIEEFLTGTEVTVLAFTDGEAVMPMVPSMDHKRIGEGDVGLNTGGMGVIAPHPLYTPEVAERCMREIFLPTVLAMQHEGRPFKGCMYFGLMLTANGPYVIEYNCRFGDPETQAVLPLLKSDLLEIMLATTEGRLGEQLISWSQDACACVVLASGGYPEQYETGYEITGLAPNGQTEHAGVTVYHAGTNCKSDSFYTAGGRVLGVTATAPTLKEALGKAYAACGDIGFEGKYLRRDIGVTVL